MSMLGTHFLEKASRECPGFAGQILNADAEPALSVNDAHSHMPMKHPLQTQVTAGISQCDSLSVLP